MSVPAADVITLDYGTSGRFSCTLEGARIRRFLRGPNSHPEYRRQLRRCLEQPLDFPPLARALIPDDSVVLALDSHTPQAAGIVAEIWAAIEQAGVEAARVLVLQPQPLNARPEEDPRGELPAAVRNRMGWKVHNSRNPHARAYLASTSHGERIYLARELIEADMVVSVGYLAYDPVMGYRGTGSVFYPGMSSAEAIAKAHGQGHHELDPESQRPMRQVVDEVAWLLGAQFSVQIVPSRGGGVADVLAGSSDSVFAAGKRLLDEHWRVRVADRADVVLVAVDADASGHGWEQVGAALATARRLVARGGKIVVLSQLDQQLGPGLEMVRRAHQPRDVLKPLRLEAPPDLLPATQFASAADWADVYLLSRLASDLVEDLFCVPLECEAEVARLLARCDSCILLGSGQHTYGEVQTHGE